ncbi:SAM-dependent methyltransferase [uncultured Flavobacterium sp.]|uniref:SAM-dependent methyltransferase n=1 Tax=uncultured Flavobacterium sp. TaxID=165435 RepID=UPI0030CA13DA
MNKKYWENRYINNKTGWDIGKISTPLKGYIDQLKNKNIKILIPGAGNGYEFDYLITQGFFNVFVIDIAEQPLKTIKIRNPEYADQIIYGDFFDLKDTFDLVLEHTFFCALNPNLRTNYVSKMNEIVNKKGKIAGLFFDFPLTEVGPPFGATYQDYLLLFQNNFKIKTLEKTYNSILERKDKELFFIFEKK